MVQDVILCIYVCTCETQAKDRDAYKDPGKVPGRSVAREDQSLGQRVPSSVALFSVEAIPKLVP